MMNESEYFEMLEYKKVEALMYETQKLTREEYELVSAWYPAFAAEFLFHNSWDDTFLNLNVYSEVEHDRYVFRTEVGF